jgi:hypothetical protein
MKNHISKFSRFINESMDTKNRYIVTFSLNPKWAESHGQGMDEIEISQKLGKFLNNTENGRKIGFSAHRGINLHDASGSGFFMLETYHDMEYLEDAIPAILGTVLIGVIDRDTIEIELSR